MTASPELRLIDEAPAPPRPEPKILPRTIQVPPGLPWDQDRAAGLEARHGAPLPLADLVYRVQRLEGWRPGAPGRYAAFYVLARDLSGRLNTEVEVDGRLVRVAFLPAGLQRQRARLFVTIVVVFAVAAFVAIASVGAAFIRRAEAEAALSSLETRAAGRLHAAEVRDRLKRQNRALDAQIDRGAPLTDVLADLAWASGAKSPDAHIEALHWERGVLAVEVRGAAAPFMAGEDRRLQRAAKPLRRGVWLWGVMGGSLARAQQHQSEAASPNGSRAGEGP